MHEREIKYTEELQKLPSEESHPVTFLLGEYSIDHTKKLEYSLLQADQMQ